MTATAKVEDTKIAAILANNAADARNGVKCELDGIYVHSIKTHLKYNHPEVSLSEYRTRFPDAEIESLYFRGLRAKMAGAKGGTAPVSVEAPVEEKVKPTKAKVVPIKKDGMTALHTIFGMTESADFKTASGKFVETMVFPAPSEEFAIYMAEADDGYVFEAHELRKINLALTLNLPLLLWGYHGTGKTTLVEQFVARTNRPWVRVQHTVSTEEAHILGQYVVKPNPDGEGNVMVFEAGPLAVAMRLGLVYVADEYDFALPSVTSVYQPVLEGKALLIKEAPPEWRIVKPHPNFRFVATGNTNGSGDESGLYQGTQIMNAANYSRFGVTMQVNYRKPKIEADILKSKVGVTAPVADNFVQFANSVRQSFASGELSATVSTRELLNAATIGMAEGGNWREGLRSAYTNRLNSTDRKAVEDYAQRIFG